MLYRAERYAESVEEYNAVIRMAPSDGSTYVGRAWAYSRLGKHPQAISSFNEAIRLQPNNAQAYAVLEAPTVRSGG